MGSSEMGSAADSGSSEPGADKQAKATEAAPGAAASDAAKDAAKDATKDAAGAKARPGSSLILIPPVTRTSDGPQPGAAPAGDPLGAAQRHPRTSAGTFGAAAAERLRAMKDKGWRYAAPAALGFCLFGAGLATGGQFFGAAKIDSGTTGGVGGAKLLQVSTDQSETRHLIKKLGDEVHALQTRVDGLRSGTQSATPDDVRALKKSLDGLRASLDATKVETGAAIALLSAKVDHFQRGESKPQPLVDKPIQSDHPAGAPTTTASVNHPPPPHAGEIQTALATPAVPKEPAPAVPPAAADPKKKPQQLLVDWVVRDVYRGVALIDGPDGSIEVGRGDPIPGAGTVESIEHRNGGWVIVTSRGIVGSVRE